MREVELSIGGWGPDRGGAVLVPAARAASLKLDGGHRELSRGETRFLFDGIADRDVGALRRFVSELEVVGVSRPFLKDGELRALIRDGIEQYDFVGFCREEGTRRGRDADHRTARLRLLVDRIDREFRGRLGLAGRSYRMVVGSDVGRPTGRESFEVLPRTEADRVIRSLEERPSQSKDVPALLAEARSHLSQDWRPPSQPDGLVLLRQVTMQASSRVSEEPAISPSQLKALKQAREKTWIEILVTDDSGLPYFGSVKVALPDGKTTTSQAAANGVLRLDGIGPGECRVTLAELESSGRA